jgi:hypothetical protein
MGTNEDGLRAAIDYLRHEFPGANIQPGSDTTHRGTYRGTTLSVLTPGSDPKDAMVTVFLFDFLALDIDVIGASLGAERVAARMRAKGPGHHFNVAPPPHLLIEL